MKVNQILSQACFLHTRIQDAKENGTTYFYPDAQFRKEMKELRSLRSQYKTLTGDWLVFG